MTEQPQYEFQFPDTKARVWHYTQLTPEELSQLTISENCYYVQLMTGSDIETFELYLGEDAEWLTKPETSQKVVEMIADKIEKITL
jgi:hypothetical protein